MERTTKAQFADGSNKVTVDVVGRANADKDLASPSSVSKTTRPPTTRWQMLIGT